MAINHPTTGRFISPDSAVGRDKSIEDTARLAPPLTAEAGRRYDHERAQLSAAARADGPIGEQLRSAHGFGRDPVGAPRRFMPGYQGAAPSGPVDVHCKMPNLDGIARVGGK